MLFKDNSILVVFFNLFFSYQIHQIKFKRHFTESFTKIKLWSHCCWTSWWECQRWCTRICSLREKEYWNSNEKEKSWKEGKDNFFYIRDCFCAGTEDLYQQGSEMDERIQIKIQSKHWRKKTRDRREKRCCSWAHSVCFGKKRNTSR